jgi:hypothetical protein
VRARLHRRGAVIAVFTATACVPSCREATEITVVVTTDLPNCEMLPGTTIAVGSPASLATALPSAVSGPCRQGTIGTLVVVPSTSGDPEVAIRVVTGVNESPDACDADGYKGGCIVARRALHFIAHTPLTVPIEMRADCENVVCNSPGALQTCIQGRCAPATVQDPSSCLGAGCGESTLVDASLPPLDSSVPPADASTTDGADANAPVTDGNSMGDAVVDARAPTDAAATEAGPADGGSCKPNNAQCTGFAECCSSECFRGICCQGPMAPCMTAADCCSTVAGGCSGGFCACMGVGGQCLQNFDCCSNNCQQGSSCG